LLRHWYAKGAWKVPESWKKNDLHHCVVRFVLVLAHVLSVSWDVVPETLLSGRLEYRGNHPVYLTRTELDANRIALGWTNLTPITLTLITLTLRTPRLIDSGTDRLLAKPEWIWMTNSSPGTRKIAECAISK
jgi:hypothetical protein